MTFSAAIFLLASLVSAQTRSGTFTIDIPDGWRLLDSSEAERLKPKVEPQTKLQERIVNESGKERAVLIAKHDVEGTIATSLQVFCNPIPDNMKYASSIELARVVAFASSVALRARYEVQPHEITVSGLPAAEWVSRYTMTESAGETHAMKAHLVLVSLANNTFYLVGCSGPAEDTVEFDTFAKTIATIKIDRNPSKR